MSDPPTHDPLDRARRVQALLVEALALPAAEWPGFLDTRCAGDASLRAAVEELLRLDAASAPALEPLPRTTLDEAVSTLGATVSGERSYRLVSELGRGGFGSVYLAERADGQYDQRVALKRLNLGAFTSAAALARFRQERQILARLSHPHIARLLDGGEMAGGAPFLVLEYVDGVPIDIYCEEHELSVTARLRLFVAVCEAVEYAHRNLVVHRDLKPSNVLVDPGGEVKLLDFGIAKLLDPEDAASLLETRQGESPLTPRYASPEQVRGQAITTATDVYSLGVLLYELLTGRSPYPQSSASPAALAAAICDTDPPRPSTIPRAPSGDSRATPGRDRRVDADLDAVVMKAMRKEPGERYGSAGALSADVERFLAGLPVEARKGSRGYRLGKLVRRHRLAFAAAVAFVLLVATFGVLLALQLAETARQRDAAQRERDAAQRERDAATAVTDFLVGTFKVADPESGEGASLTAREILDRGAQRVAGELAGKPEIQARLLHAIGRVYQNLGLYEQATSELESALRLRRRLEASDPTAYGVVTSDLASVLLDRNQFARAEPLFRSAIAILSAARGPTAAETLEAKNGLANLMRTTGRLAEAESLMRELLATNLAARGLTEPPGPGGPPLDEGMRPIGVRLHNLGALELDLGHYDLAHRFLEQAIAVKSRLAKRNPASEANSIDALANVEDSRQRFQQGLELHERALAILRQVYGDDHPSIAESLVNRGGSLAGLGRHAEALADYQRAAAILQRAFGRDHAYVAMALNNAANSMRAMGDLAGALALHRDVLAIRERVLGRDHPEVALSLTNIGGLELALGHPREAMAADERAVAISTRALGAEHPDTLDRRSGLAIDRLAAGDAHTARLELEALVPLIEMHGTGPFSVAEAQFALARAEAADGGDPAQAVALATQVRARVAAHPDLRAGGLTLAEIDEWLRGHQ